MEGVYATYFFTRQVNRKGTDKVNFDLKKKDSGTYN
jgi:hypothetical protein